MKTKDLKNLRSKSIKELGKLVDTKRKDLLKEELATMSGKQKNLKAVKNLKRDIAQILTIIREKEIIKINK